MKNIYLVGFMGTGKTAVGKALAKKTGRKFVDLDDVIEAREGRTIREIFASDKEPYFRKIEKESLKELAPQKGLVIAAGGGIVIDKDNIRTMKETGRMFCLTASVDEIIKRTRGASHRPLLNVPDPRGKIESLLKERAHLYARADDTVDTSGLPIREVVDIISKRIA